MHLMNKKKIKKNYKNDRARLAYIYLRIIKETLKIILTRR